MDLTTLLAHNDRENDLEQQNLPTADESRIHRIIRTLFRRTPDPDAEKQDHDVGFGGENSALPAPFITMCILALPPPPPLITVTCPSWLRLMPNFRATS
jgi:hypothetical protein